MKFQNSKNQECVFGQNKADAIQTLYNTVIDIKPVIWVKKNGVPVTLLKLQLTALEKKISLFP